MYMYIYLAGRKQQSGLIRVKTELIDGVTVTH